MPHVPVAKLIQLQQNPSHIRNICILAHVDHGKTSLADSLIATNGIISPKLAGKVRYLDSRPDEQLRGITMESSAISLYFSMLRRHHSSPTHPASDEPVSSTQEEYLINLIDSPGHIDFSSEVSTASRLSDAAVVLVDAVEGVCSQTVTVLHQVWLEKLKPLLVINKIDRLITELKMTPLEAYAHLERVLEGVNAVIGGFRMGERMEEDLLWREMQDTKLRGKEKQEQEEDMVDADNKTDSGLDSAAAPEFEDKDDEDLYFAPDKNNVIFASAIDGWAFALRQFSALYSKKLNINRSVLERVLWGDYYLDPKTKKVLAQKHLKGRNLKPIFVQLVLEPIWTVYEATVGISAAAAGGGSGDPALLEKITKSLNITLPAHVQRSRDPKSILHAVFASWLPLSTALLVSVVEYLPSPIDAQAARMPALIDDLVGTKAIDARIKKSMINFDTEPDAPVVAYVSKMVAIPESELPSKTRARTAGPGSTLTPDEARELARRKRAEIAKVSSKEGDDEGTNNRAEEEKEEEDDEAKEDPEHLIGFGRLFSGRLSVGDEVYVLPPKFNPLLLQDHPHERAASALRKKVKITHLYLLMGRSLENLDTVPAGTIFGIGGLEGHILKTGTLCSQVQGGVNLATTSSTQSASQPIVRVALEPTNPTDLNKMIRGLKLLEQSDPCAMYEQMPSGEHVILTAGELHLERCLKDLRERYARCDVQTGDLIVPYRETIVKPREDDISTAVAETTAANNNANTNNKPKGTVIAVPASKTVSVKLRVVPLPKLLTNFLIENGASVRKLYAEKQAERSRRGRDGLGNGHDDDDDDDDDDKNDNKDTRITTTKDKTTQDDDDDDNDLRNAAAAAAEGTGQEKSVLSMSEFRKQLQTVAAAAGPVTDECEETEGEGRNMLWKEAVQHICAFGPRRVGPNIFVDVTGRQTCNRFLSELNSDDGADDDGNNEKKDDDDDDTAAAVTGTNGHNGYHKGRRGPDLSDTIVYAFQLATAQGPLCREPMQGVAVFLQSIDYHHNNNSSATESAITTTTGGTTIGSSGTTSSSTATTTGIDNTGRLTGELINAVRESIRGGFLEWSPRILLAMYRCTIQVTPDVLGRVYAVLTRRRGTIQSEQLLEGTPYFTIEASLPVAESLGFAEELRKRTSGLAAQPMLQFTGFAILDDLDPFWVPKTEEELEDLGVHGERENVAKRYVDAVRRRKGLLVRSARGGGRDAEKQKTLKTN